MTIVINGTNTPVAGSIGYGDGTNLAFTAAGTTGQVLTSATAGVPTWTTVLPIANGGTNSTATPTAGGVAYGTGTAIAVSAAGTTGQVLTSGVTGAPTWTTISSAPFLKVSSRSTNTILGTADTAYVIQYTSGTFSQTFTAAATLGSGWFAYFQNIGTGVITLDPNGSETIGGVTTAALNLGDVWLVECDGTNFQLQRLQGMNKQSYTSGVNSFVVPAGVYRLYAEAWGGGGGAGGAGVNQIMVAAGGSYSAGWINTTPGATITATVGAGGTGSLGVSTNGGNSTFSPLTAGGGTRAQNNTLTAGGTASGGDYNFNGGTGYQLPSTSYGFQGQAPMSAGSTLTGGGGYFLTAGASPGQGAAIFSDGNNGAAGGSGQIVIKWV
jgi:hypothetical protein